MSSLLVQLPVKHNVSHVSYLVHSIQYEEHNHHRKSLLFSGVVPSTGANERPTSAETSVIQLGGIFYFKASLFTSLQFSPVVWVYDRHRESISRQSVFAVGKTGGKTGWASATAVRNKI